MKFKFYTYIQFDNTNKNHTGVSYYSTYKKKVSIQIFWLILFIVDDHLHDHCPRFFPYLLFSFDGNVQTPTKKINFEKNCQDLLVKRMVTTICCYASCIVE